ncbi:homoserine dehydrogenase [Paraburkholderia sp. Tr-20389]|uniref:homoserine dehydrogenase n=1 Tax=Paraburkholderia sp. Tr-20389 TaxID=2703903 RepID=UPI001981F993|nr:homoserine dehydrogenase [Paraburkholderia sp. Tr-20389]MBN3756001.1 homoserine dehydrogenase [Paraburkholderia sp. Tr-20389]
MELKLALVGFGGVNQGLVELLRKKRETLAGAGLDVLITMVADLRLGIATNPRGIALDVLDETARRGVDAMALRRDPGTLVSPDVNLDAVLKAIASEHVDVVIEATFTDPNTGEPALSHCRTALECGKHVITTNKGPIALAQQELARIATKSDACLMYEGTVMSGTPVLRQIATTLRGCDVNGFAGILNGTSNFVLGQVEAGANFDAAIREAQQRGYAEADPAADVNGSDVQLKVVILANTLWNAGLQRRDVHCRGIVGLTGEDVRVAAAEGMSWRLVGSAVRRPDGTVTASVEPRKLPASHPLRAASGVTNAIMFDTDVLGSVTISGPGAGRQETAFAILSDLIELVDRIAAAAPEVLE